MNTATCHDCGAHLEGNAFAEDWLVQAPDGGFTHQVRYFCDECSAVNV